MTLKNLIDEELDTKTIMMQVQQLQQIDKQNQTTVGTLKNNPELLKSFQGFQQLVQQQLKLKQLEAQKVQQAAQAVVTANAQANTAQAAQSASTVAAATTANASV